MLGSENKNARIKYTRESRQFIINDEDASVALIKNLDLDIQRTAILEIVNKIWPLGKREQLKRYSVDEEIIHPRFTLNISADEMIYSYYYSVYFNAACSMAIVGILVPTIEAMFYELFNNIGELIGDKLCTACNNRINISRKEIVWDCHYSVTNGKAKKNIVEGIFQLAETTGFHEYLPNDYKQVIVAMFGYRNITFHNGFEWSDKCIEKFGKNIWVNEWFDCSKKNDRPWIYCLSPMMVERSLILFDEIEIAAGSYYKNNCC